jgi:DNA repair photolyase
MANIYKPKGRALEYSAYALNIYNGCKHDCSYCFAPSMMKVNRNKFSSDDYIKPTVGTLLSVERQLKKQRITEPVLLSFTCDPYQPIELKEGHTRDILSLFDNYGVKAQILTKSGIEGITRDIDLLKKSKAIWAVTLTTDNDTESRQWEPAALPDERIEALRIAKKNGLSTWVSFEPVFNPDAVFRLFEKTKNFVDLYKVGKINYHPVEKTIDWKQFLVDVEKKFSGYPVYIKKDLEAYR